MAKITFVNVCNVTFLLDDYRPATKLEITFYDNFEPNTTLCITTFVTLTTDFFLGVLLLERPYPARLCNPGDGCFCETATFVIKYDDGEAMHFCNDRGVYQLESHIMTRSLKVVRRKDHYPAMYTILIFRYRLECENLSYTDQSMVQCKNAERCIDNSIICNPPYTYCGDDSYLCQGTTGGGAGNTVHGSKGSMIAGSVVTCGIFLLMGVVCYMCVGKDRICRIKQICRGRSDTNETRAASQRIFSVQFTTRGVASNGDADDVGTINISFSEGPPDYDTVVSASRQRDFQTNTEENCQTNARGDITGDGDSDEKPPCYQTVMANAFAYNVKSSTSTM